MSESSQSQWVDGGSIVLNCGHENLVEQGLMIVEFADKSQGIWPTAKTSADIEFVYAKSWHLLRKRVTALYFSSKDMAEFNKEFFKQERIILSGGARTIGSNA